MLLFLQNIRSLGSNYDELIATFETNQIMPPLLALTETWLKDYSNNQLLCNKNLQNIVTCNRLKKRAGGEDLLASKEDQLTTIKTSASNDIQVLTANCASKNQCFVVSIVYKASQMDILTFQNFLLEHFLAIWPKNNHILCEDLNIYFSKNYEKTGIFLRELGFLKIYLKSKKNEPTRKTIRSNSTLDVFFSNFECETAVLKTKVSDHYWICLKLSDLNDN